MKYAVALLAFAASTIAQEIDARWGGGVAAGWGGGGAAAGGAAAGWGGDDKTKTLVTYTTLTTCPVTATVTDKGTTYKVTKLTTSTVVVTECKNCVTTVPGPNVIKGTTTQVEITYTTTCPVTETITAPGKTYVTTYTTTSVCVTVVPTTVYQTVAGPGATITATDVVVSVLTSLCPITDIKTIAGKTVYVTWTSTTLITTTALTTTYLTQYTDVTVGTGAVETDYSVTTVVVGGTIQSTQAVTAPGTTVVVPLTTVKTATSAPSQVVTAAAVMKAPAGVLMAGVFGAMALL